MTLPILLAVFAIPTISIPFVYFAGKKSPKAAAIFVALIALINILLGSIHCTSSPQQRKHTDTLNLTLGFQR